MGVDPVRVAAACVELADTLAEDFDLIEFLHTLVERCVDLLDVSAVGLMLGDGRGRLRVMASSAERMRLLELFQLQHDQGPCLECYRAGTAVDEPDLAAATERWPLFAPEAVRTGLGAVHALPMRLRTQTVGALNLFHDEPGGLREDHTRVAQCLVDVATIGLIQVQLGHRGEILLGQLGAALDSRVVIEQAKGFVAEHRGITPAAAFTVLRDYSRAHRSRLTDVAYAVIASDPGVADLLVDGRIDAPRSLPVT
jgi:GAF domain-containing protein